MLRRKVSPLSEQFIKKAHLPPGWKGYKETQDLVTEVRIRFKFLPHITPVSFVQDTIYMAVCDISSCQSLISET